MDPPGPSGWATVTPDVRREAERIHAERLGYCQGQAPPLERRRALRPERIRFTPLWELADDSAYVVDGRRWAPLKRAVPHHAETPFGAYFCGGSTHAVVAGRWVPRPDGAWAPLDPGAR